MKVYREFLFILLFTGNLFSQQTVSSLLAKENYIPTPFSENDILKTVHIAIHVWQRGDGSGNLKDTPEHRARLYKVIDWMNLLYSQNAQSTTSVSYPVGRIEDSRIRFKLEKIYFYKDQSADSSFCYSTKYLHNKKLNDFLKQNYPERTKTLNLHIFRGSYPGAAGYSEYGSVGTFYRTDPDMSSNDVHDWWLSKHWAHEIGHGFDLWHTYDPNSKYQQNCSKKYTDFLWDIYDTTQVSQSKGCGIELITDKKNNNLMGGQEADYKSPLQVGIMHRATVLENVYNTDYQMRDFVTGYSGRSKVVEVDTEWNRSLKIYQDVVVKSGVTLIISKEVQFVSKACLKIEPGARVIVDGAKLTSENYYSKAWKGVFGSKAKGNLPAGRLELKNGASVQGAKKMKIVVN